MTTAITATKGTPVDSLLAAMGAYVRYAMARPSRYQLLFALQPLEAEALRDLPGLVRPAYRAVIGPLEQMRQSGRKLPTVDAIDAAMLTLSLAHGRIALAQTAPHMAGNTPEGVEAFVLDALGRIFSV